MARWGPGVHQLSNDRWHGHGAPVSAGLTGGTGSGPCDVLIALWHGTDEPAYASHALRLALASTAFGDSVGLYLAVHGTTLLAEDAPEDLTATLVEARELGLNIYACPTSIAEHELSPPTGTYEPLGAAAALEAMRQAHTVVTF